jgi:hypothetical protein
MKMKKTIIITAVLLAVGIAAVIVFLTSAKINSGNTESRTPVSSEFTLLHNIVWVDWHNYEETFVSLLNGEIVALDGNYADEQSSIDQTKMAVAVEPVLMYNSGHFNDDFTGYSLYLIGENSTIICDKGAMNFFMSSDGSAVAYYTDLDLSEYKENFTAYGDLVLYKNGKTKKIADDIELGETIRVSPDGNTVFYVEGYNDDPNLNTSYLYKNGENIKIATGITPEAVSNDGEYLYYVMDEDLYVQTGTNYDSRRNLGYFNYDYILNENHNEIINIVDMRPYISVGGGEIHELPDYKPVVPENIASTGHSYGIKTFVDMMYYTEDGDVVRVKSDFETELFAKNVKSPTVSIDNSTFFYIKNGILYKKDITKTDSEEIEIVNNAISFIITEDGSALWYVNDDNELFYIEGDSTAVKVADDVYSVGTLYLGETLYYVSGGALFATSNGEKGRHISEITENITYVGSYGNQIVVGVDTGHTTAYRSSDGVNFEFTY